MEKEIKLMKETNAVELVETRFKTEMDRLIAQFK